MRILSALSRILGGLALFLVAVLLLATLWGVARIATHEQTDDSVHLEAKRDYLETLRASHRLPSVPSTAQTPSPRPAPGAGGEAPTRPNVLIILFDDLGFGDLGAYGARAVSTPHIDGLAQKGLRLENYYAASSVCTPSRAALLTGRYAPRAGLNHVVFPTGSRIDRGLRLQGLNTRLPGEEILLSEILSAVGYDTGMVGKWHLGDDDGTRPLQRGFERYFGALYSNDMTPFAIYRGDEIEHPAPYDQTRMKDDYIRAAVEFLEREREGPFFLYFAHNFPHIPLYTPDRDIGRSQAGLYGDVIEGLDDSVGALLDVLERRGELNDTLILLTSDNGPWFEGSPGSVRGRKNQTWEGGMRVPFVAHWPGRIAPGSQSDAPVVGVDVVPTLLSLLELPSPSDRLLDGIDQTPLFLAEPASPGGSADRLVYYFGQSELDAIREGRFKYHRRRGVRMTDAGDGFAIHELQGPWLFDLELDPSESYDVSRRHPEIAQAMAARFAAEKRALEENPRGWR